ncbi:hypothetical protein QS257_01695 [Terrilactibacillus sp. S3-3]|nr:hypothetical protein QS257_01695 [Terrilactibacillus sp. S3-3]
MKNGIISDGCFATIRIREYQSIFYWTSDYSYINENYKIKVYWSAEELKDIIHFLWNYLKHEEKILEKNYDPFGMIGEAKNRFEIITEIAMFIIGEYLKINNDNCDYLIKELKNFIIFFVNTL